MANFKINKDSPVPLHVQLVNELRQMILAKEFEPHSRVPSEPQLAVTLNISRTTIRQACTILSLLIGAGFYCVARVVALVVVVVVSLALEVDVV